MKERAGGEYGSFQLNDSNTTWMFKMTLLFMQHYMVNLQMRYFHLLFLSHAVDVAFYYFSEESFTFISLVKQFLLFLLGKLFKILSKIYHLQVKSKMLNRNYNLCKCNWSDCIYRHIYPRGLSQCQVSFGDVTLL